MFIVRAIQDKELQRSLCESLGADYCENALAYFAADLCEDCESIAEYIGICQFIMQGDGEIVSFSSYEDRYEDEAMIVMLRAVMSFMHRCGVKYCFLNENAAPRELAQKSGFIYSSGTYGMDLEKFYSSKCCH